MSIAYRISAFNRKRKWELFSRLFAVTPRTRVLDVGFTDTEYSESDNFLEKHYPHLGQITALGIEDPVKFRAQYPEVQVVLFDGAHFPFPSGQFDICWSNAVLEHVGDEEAQVLFLQEIVRTSGEAFITTPNKYFPIEVHTRLPFVHWLPKRWFDAVLRRVGKGWATGSYMTLLSERDLHRLLARAGVARERYEIVRNRFLGFTLDFVIVVKR